MPTYEYACTACAERLEAVQKFSDPPLTECPACGGALRKVFSPVGVVFKGSGFYKTDSRSGSKPVAAKPDASAVAASSSSSSDGGSSGSADSGSSAAPSTGSTSSSGDSGSSSTAPASKAAS